MKTCLNSILIIFGFVLLFSNCAPKREMVLKVEKEEIKPTIMEKKSLIEDIKEKREAKRFSEIIKIYEERKSEFTTLEIIKPVILAYLSEKRFDDIVKIGEEKLSKLPSIDDNETNLILGMAYYERGLFEAARRVLINLYEGGYKNELLNIYLSMIYIKRNQVSLALTVAGEIEDPVKKSYIQGKIYFYEGSYEKALDRLLMAKEYKGSELYILYCRYYLGRYDDILKEYEDQKIQLDSRTVPLLAAIFVNQGEIKRAKELLESLSEKERKGSFYRNLGLIYDIYFDNKERAKDLYSKYLKEVQDEEVMSWLNN